MNLTLIASLITAALLLGMLLCVEGGRRIGIAKLARHPDCLSTGVGASEGAIFGLLGLMIAFAFSGAATRFENRRHLITQEANAIGTAYLRIDLLPGDTQPQMRTLFGRYLDSRLAVYENVRDEKAVATHLANNAVLQSSIWNLAVNAGRRPDTNAGTNLLVLPALNEMFDITTTRLMATRNHPPLVVLLLLPVLSLIGALLGGYDMSGNKDRSWLHTLAFATVLSVTVYLIIDLEFPRLGLIRVDAADQVLVDLRKSMQ